MIAIVFLLAFLFRLAISPLTAYWGDLYSWIGWSNRIVEVGFKNFYQSWCDYLPGYIYILWILGNIKNFFLSLGLPIPNILLYKLPSILADLGTAFFINKIVTKLKNKKTALIAATVYLFNPAIFINSAVWGQTDGFFTFFALMALYFFIENKIWLSTIVLGLTCIIKPLGFFLLPLVFVFMVFKKPTKQLVYYFLIVFVVILASFIPFSDANLFKFIWQRINVTFSQYPYTSLNAFNFWSFLSIFWQKDSFKFLFLSYKNWGFLIFSLMYLLTLALVIKTKVFKKIDNKTNVYYFITTAAIIFFSSFLFLTRIHERHLLPVFAFLNIVMVINPFYLFIYFLSSVIYVLNLAYAYVWLTFDFKTIFSPLVIRIFSGLQIANFIVLFFYLKDFNYKFDFKKLKLFLSKNFIKRLDLKTSQNKEVKLKKVVVKHRKLYLSLILLFALITRVLNIWHPQAYIFDEVYHGFTAQEIAKGNIKAWEWWNPSPEGFAYEWTHPPLAKLIMAGGVLLFGKNDAVSQYAFRFPAVLFGVGVIYLTYLLVIKIFNNEKIALIAALLLSLDGLLFVMSRVGMTDVYFLFFLLFTILMALEEKYLFSGIFLGLSLATKWTGIYLYPVIFLILMQKLFLEGKKLFKPKPLLIISFSYLLLPCLIYLFSYTMFFTSGHSLTQFKDLQKQMWWYHTNLKASHDYQSKAISWPFMWRPVWFWVEYKEKAIANIYNLGNPIIWWTGLFILPIAIYQSFKQLKQTRTYKLGLIVFCYFIFWLPWIISPRVMFLHHYLPAIPFLSILIAWFLDISEQWEISSRRFLYIFLTLTLLVFIFFYPLYTGILIPKSLLKYFFWFPSWK